MQYILFKLKFLIYFLLIIIGIGFLTSCSNTKSHEFCTPMGLTTVQDTPKNIVVANSGIKNNNYLTIPPSLKEIQSNNLPLKQPGTLTVGTLTDAPPSICVNNSGNFTGFDNELLKSMAKKLGLKINFIATDFSTLLENVARGRFDVGSSSINATELRRKKVNFTNPYDFGYSALVVNQFSKIKTFSDLKTTTKLGVVLGTVQDDYVNQNKLPAIKFQDYVSVFNSLKTGKLTAWIAPLSQAENLLTTTNNLKITQYLFNPNNLVAWAVSKNNPRLVTALNAALDEIIADGTWKKLFESWTPKKLPANWKPGSPNTSAPDLSKLTAALAAKNQIKNPNLTYIPKSTWQQLLDSFFAKNIYKETFPKLLTTGLKNTLIITFFAGLISIILGSLLALAGISKFILFRIPARIYTDIFRGLPELLVIVLIGIGLEPIFRNLTHGNPFPLGILALGLLSAAYLGEILRSGFQSVPRNQIEAAYALGFTHLQTIITIIIPQGYRKVLPAIMNQVIILIKASSLLFVIGLTYKQSDIFTLAKVGNANSGSLSPLMVAGICYLIITIPLTHLINYFDKKINS